MLQDDSQPERPYISVRQVHVVQMARAGGVRVAEAKRGGASRPLRH